MRVFTKTIRRFWSDQEGLETIEYAVMTALIVAALITAVVAVAAAVTGRFSQVEGTIAGIDT